jgi:cell wall-associated NlpC family hydrolase
MHTLRLKGERDVTVCAPLRALVLFLCLAVVLLWSPVASAHGKSRSAKRYSKRSAKTSVVQRERFAVVNVPFSDVFGQGSESSEHITEVLLGDEFRVVSERGEWAFGYIPSQMDYRGWIKKENLLFSPVDYPAKNSSFVLVKSAQTMLTRRDGSSLSVFAGTRLPLMKNDTWRYEVLLPDGSRGYVPAAAAWISSGPSPADVTADDILEASKFHAANYKWGGITSGGMDCSGFVYTSFRVNGIFLKRDSYLQAEEGVNVSQTELQPGDLVFFQSPRAKRITHVGIYIGNGNFIHSSRGKKGVAVSSLSDEPFKHTYAGARRILSRTNKTARLGCTGETCRSAASDNGRT